MGKILKIIVQNNKIKAYNMVEQKLPVEQSRAWNKRKKKRQDKTNVKATTIE